MKKKILFILHIPPPVHGAAMVGKFIKESTLINNEFESTYINLGTSTNLNEIGKSGFSKLTSVFKIQKTVFKAMKEIKPDLVYMTLTANGPGFYKDVMIVRIVKLFKTGIIYHFHNKGFSRSIGNVFNRALHRFALRNTKSILLSRHLFNDISYYVKHEDVYFCANGIPSAQPVINIKNDSSFRILYLSNMMEEKGVWTLLDACKILKSKNINFHCDFVGDWFDITAENFKTKVSCYNLDQDVTAHGKQYGTDKIKFFENANVFVFPTFYKNECFPLVLLEAMDYGLPVISTPEGGIEDIVENNVTGYVVPQKNVKDLADKLELLSQQPALAKKMGEAGKHKFTSEFTLKQFEENLSNILRKESEN